MSVPEPVLSPPVLHHQEAGFAQPYHDPERAAAMTAALPWFRLYHEARNDAKLRTLADDEHRVWFHLLCLAAECDDRGTVPLNGFLLAVEVAAGDEALMERTIEKLVRLRILDRGENDRLYFLKFGDRQYDKPSDHPERVSERVRRHRAAKATPGNAQSETGNADVTPSNALEREGDRDTERERENGANAPQAEPADPEPVEPIPIRIEAGGRTDGQVYALVDAFAIGKGMTRSDVVGKYRQTAYRTFAQSPPGVGPTEVQGCTAYLMTDPFWEPPGKLKPDKVLETLPEWLRKGRPASIQAATTTVAATGPPGRQVRNGKDIGWSNEEIDKRLGIS